MTFGSRLTMRQRTKTITVYSRSSAGTETAVTGLASVEVTYHQKQMTSVMGEQYGGMGEVVAVVIHQFWFYPDGDGNLPAITEQHVIYEDGNTTTQYEIFNVVDEGGQGDVLKVETQRRRL